MRDGETGYITYKITFAFTLIFAYLKFVCLLQLRAKFIAKGTNKKAWYYISFIRKSMVFNWAFVIGNFRSK